MEQDHPGDDPAGDGSAEPLRLFEGAAGGGQITRKTHSRHLQVPEETGQIQRARCLTLSQLIITPFELSPLSKYIRHYSRTTKATVQHTRRR